MAIVSFLILKMLMLVSICEKAFGKIGKDEKGRGGIHSGKFSVVKFNLMTYSYAEFRGADFFPVEIFPKPNGDSNSVKNSESHDIKFLT